MSDNFKKLPKERLRDVQALAWRVLVNNGINSLPVDIYKICQSEGIFLLGYPTNASIIAEMGFGDSMKNDIGFCCKKMIFFSEELSECEKRVTIAHELGHVLMHTDCHVKDNYPCKSETVRTMAEEEASLFADRLLCPTAILNFIGVNSAEEIAELCQVDMETAKRRYIRLCRARAFDKKRRSENKRSTFLLSGMEKMLYENMKDFVEANKISRESKSKEDS